jgi:hypothetical protein
MAQFLRGEFIQPGGGHNKERIHMGVL